MLSRDQLRLVTLGRLALLRPQGDADPALASRRRHLAVLAVLAFSRRPLSRDQLVEMFWGGQPEERARHSLSNTLSLLRRVLGRDALVSRGGEVELELPEELEVDAVLFAQAATARDDVLAVELYGGPFLNGVHVEDSPTFDQWATGERLRLEKLFVGVCQRRCLALARAQEWSRCAELASRWLDAAPLSADAAIYRLNSLRAPGTREAYRETFAEYERLRARLRRDYGAEPDGAVSAIARDVAGRIAAEQSDLSLGEQHHVAEVEVVPNIPPAEAPASSGGEVTPTAGPIVVDEPSVTAAPARRMWPFIRQRRWILTASAVGAAALFAASGFWLRGGADAGAADPPVVAIVDIAFFGDSADGWVAEGLPQMMVAKLTRSSGVEVIEPGRVRDTRLRYEAPVGAPLATERAREIARRLGASWMVTGAVVDADTALRLDLTIRSTRTGDPVRAFTVQAPNVLALADAAATRLLDAAGAERGGVALAELETSSIEAYEQFIQYLHLRTYDPERAYRALDASVALDSGFVSALLERIAVARLRGEPEIVEKLDVAFQRAAHRATDWDRLSMAAHDAYRTGAWPRAEATARALVDRFPRDPRAHQWMMHVYIMQGRWEEAERAGMAQLALDSLAMAGGRGPCVTCDAYLELANVRMGGLGDYPGAERLLRRLIELQPDVPNAWSMLARSLAGQRRADEALAAERRALVLAGHSAHSRTEIGRLLIEFRRYDAADSAWRAMARDRNEDVRMRAMELRHLLERERGRYRTANHVIDSVLRARPQNRDLGLMLGHGLGELGDHAGARRVFGSRRHELPLPGAFRSTEARSMAAELARGFAWWHALEADAVAAAGDTVLLRALADSIESIGGISYYGRDRRLHHHVRGLIAMRAQRWEEARTRFHASRWGAWGWTRSPLHESRALLALGRPGEAIATLRPLYGVPLDGMGRYTPKSELDYWMAVAFKEGGQADSARVYATHVRAAWRDADPEIRARLRILE